MWLGWQIWGAIRYPQKAHAVFRLAKRPRRHNKIKRNDWWRASLILLIVAIPPTIICAIDPIFLIPFLIGIAFTIPVILVMSGTILGSMWLFDITRTLLDLQQSRRYDLISITPIGAFGTSWLVAMGIIHRTQSFKRLAQVYSISIRTIAVLGVSITAIVWIVSFNNDASFVRGVNQVLFAANILPVLVIASAIYIDQIHSITLSVLLGITATTIRGLGTSLAIFSVVVFIALQLATYAIVALGVFMLFIIFQTLLASDLLANSLAMIFGLLLFYLLREALIGILVRVIMQRFALTPTTFQAAISAQSD